jgi:hypothetical protein
MEVPRDVIVTHMGHGDRESAAGQGIGRLRPSKRDKSQVESD